MAQDIRPTQYVTTFGPGAIIETPTGPFLLRSTDAVIQQLHHNQVRPSKFEINDLRLQRGILNGGRVFRIPDENLEKGFSHPTKAFPYWNLCVKTHKENVNVIHRRSDGCPKCMGQNREDSKKPMFAIRFVSACPQGHLSDVNWSWVIHRDSPSPCTHSEFFLWHGTGSSLSSIEIQCPQCNIRKTLGDIYQLKQNCSGYYPERESDREQCSQKATVIQRGANQIRIPEVITSLTIPPARAIHNVLQREGFTPLFTSLSALGATESNFQLLLQEFVKKHHISEMTRDAILQYSFEEISEAYQELEDSVQKKTMIEYLIQEHRALEYAAESGYPPHPSESERRAGEPPRFQVNSVEIKPTLYTGSKKIPFRIMPIARLRTVLVQKAYRRVDFDDLSIPATEVAGIDSDNPGVLWYPGVDHFGEGIFIDIDTETLKKKFYPSSSRAVQWDTALNQRPPAVSITEDLVEWNALTIWWHTLAHRLINAVSIHSGYSSTSIRERVYFTSDEKRGSRGAILLYTTQAGGDGTMGGLTSLVPQFEEIFRLALETSDNCSNDPLCFDAELDLNLNLGSACYSCAMVSETSCEHRNGYIDRKLLLENMP